jgi:hypothetical protein
VPKARSLPLGIPPSLLSGMSAMEFPTIFAGWLPRTLLPVAADPSSPVSASTVGVPCHGKAAVTLQFSISKKVFSTWSATSHQQFFVFRQPTTGKVTFANVALPRPQG